MKKVFSLEKFIADCIADGDGTNGDEIISRYPWARLIDGRTTEQINGMGYLTHECWMTEVGYTSLEEEIYESI